MGIETGGTMQQGSDPPIQERIQPRGRLRDQPNAGAQQYRQGHQKAKRRGGLAWVKNEQQQQDTEA
jgi:hypothetical protein